MALAWSSYTRFHEGRPAASVKRRGAGDRAQRLEKILATLPSGRQERGQDGRDVGIELRAEAAGGVPKLVRMLKATSAITTYRRSA